MPVLPSVADQLPDVPRASGGVAQISGAGYAASRAAALGQKLTEIANQELDQQDQFAYAQAKIAYLNKKTELESSLQNDQDWKTLPKRYTDAMGQVANDVSNSLGTPRLQEQFKAMAGLDIAEGKDRINKFSNGVRIDQGRADLSGLLKTVHDNALADPTNAPAYIESAHTAIAGARAQNFISAQEEQSQREAFTTDYAKGFAVLQPPDTRIKLLNARLGISEATAPTTTSGGGDIKSALFGQESSYGANTKTSVTGARGPMQVEPATFKRFAKAGEKIDNPQDNIAVGNRYVDYLSGLPNVQGDPARIAVGYFSGEGNIAPLGVPQPYVSDKKDPTGKHTSAYVSDVLGRMGGGTSTAKLETAPQKTGTPIDWIPVDEATVMREQAIRQRHADLQLTLDTQNAVQKLQDRSAADDLMTRIYAGKASTQDIIRSNLPAFGENSKNELLGVASRMAQGTTNPAAFNTLFQGIHSGKVTSDSELAAHAGVDLSFEDFKRLRDEMHADPAEKQLKTGLFNVAKQALTRANPLMGIVDPKGEEQLQRFTSWFLTNYEKERASGKTPQQLLNPDSKDYLGNHIKIYQRSPQQLQSDLMGANQHMFDDKPTASTPAAAAPVPPPTKNYTSKDDVVKDYKTGHITRDLASKILRDKGWAQ